MTNTITWCCRDCQAAMESIGDPVDLICPACARTRRIRELTARRTTLCAELEAIEIELYRLEARC